LEADPITWHKFSQLQVANPQLLFKDESSNDTKQKLKRKT